MAHERRRALSTMIGLAIAARDLKAAEGYLLELMAYCAFSEDTLDEDDGTGNPKIIPGAS